MIRSERHYHTDSRFFTITVGVIYSLLCFGVAHLRRQVGSARFRIPFVLLTTRCQVFKDCSTLPVAENDNNSDLQLHSVTPAEFRAFLDFLLNPQCAFPFISIGSIYLIALQPCQSLLRSRLGSYH